MFQFQTGSFPLLYTCLILIAPVAAALVLVQQRSLTKNGKTVPPVQLTVFVSIASLMGARLAYVLFCMDIFFYDWGLPAIFDLRVGSCLMYGGILGALLGGAILARLRKVSVPYTLDELAVPGLTAIAICRFAEAFTTEGIGPILESEALCFFPIAVPNEYGEWNLAVFMLEALAALGIIMVLLRIRPQKEGERILTALLLFSCCQIPLENLRWDNYLRIGFVRVSQVIAALVIFAVTFIRSRRGGMRICALRMGAALLCTGGIGIIEWAQDKTNIPNTMLYMAMIVLCMAMALNAKQSTVDRRSL